MSNHDRNHITFFTLTGREPLYAKTGIDVPGDPARSKRLVH